MAACDSSLQTLSWEDESSWAENVSTMTRAVRLVSPIDTTGITQAMLDPQRVVSTRNDGTKGTPGPWSVQFTFSCWWTGRGSTSAGAVTLTDLYELLKRAMGGGAVAAASGTTLTGGTANIPTTTASGTFSAGGLCFVGALGDGDGEGQAYAIADHTGNNLTLLTNLAGAPVNGAVLYAPDLAYLAPSGCSMTGLRFRIQTADLQWVIHSCYISSLKIVGLNPGERPRLDFTVVGSWPEPVAETFPAAPTTPDAFTGEAVTAGGSCWFNTVATATHARIALRQLSIDLALGVAPQIGGAGVNNSQVITGATRTTDTVRVDAMVDGLGSDATPLYWDEFATNSAKHMLFTLNTGDGSGRAAYLRNLCYTGNRPSQSSLNGRNTIPVSFVAYNGSTTTTDLTRSSLILAGY